MSGDGKCSAGVSCRIVNMSVLCSFLVVLAHVGHAEPGTPLAWLKNFVFDNFSFPAVIPFFSFVSGYFLARHVDEPGWYKVELSKRVRTLVVPYFFWSAAYFALMLGLGFMMDVIHDVRLGTTFVNCFGVVAKWRWCALGFDLTESPLVAPLWYLRVLFVFCLISPIVVWFMSRNCRMRLILSFAPMILTLWLVTRLIPCLSGYFTWTLQVGYLWFFMAGIAVRRDPKLSLPRPLANILLLLALVFVVFNVLGIRSLPGGSVLQTLAFDGLKPLCMVYLTWRVMPAIRLPAWLTSSAFAIYVMHCLFIGAWDIVFGCWPSANGSVLAKFVLGCGGSVLVVNVLRRNLPKVSESVLGGR